MPEPAAAGSTSTTSRQATTDSMRFQNSNLKKKTMVSEVAAGEGEGEGLSKQ